MLFPIGTKNPPERTPYITYALLATNVLLYFATSTGGLRISEKALQYGGLARLDMQWYQFITSTFLHGNLSHLIGNMLFLWIFGRSVEGRLGYWKFFSLYFLAGVAGDALQLMFTSGHPEIKCIGASGAIMGVIGAALYMFPFAPIKFFYWFYIFWTGTFDLALWIVACFYFLMDIMSAALTSSLTIAGGVANFAHIGGFIAGFLITALFRPARDSQYVSETKAIMEDSHDYRVLTRTQLAELYESNKNNDELILYWMYRTVKDRFQITQEQWNVFMQRLPTLVQSGEEDIMMEVLLHFSTMPGVLPTSYYNSFAHRLEKAGKPQQAGTMFDRVLHDQQAPPNERELALYQLALLREAWFQDFRGAEHLLTTFLREFPMSPMAPQAKQRLAVVSPKAAAQKAASP